MSLLPYFYTLLGMIAKQSIILNKEYIKTCLLNENQLNNRHQDLLVIFKC